jgi:hypothetical protein
VRVKLLAVKASGAIVLLSDVDELPVAVREVPLRVRLIVPTTSNDGDGI